MHVQGSRREGVQSQSAVCCMKYQLFALKFSSYISFGLGQSAVIFPFIQCKA